MADNYIADYEDFMLEADKSPKSIANYLSDVNQFIRWYESEREPFDPLAITTPTLVAYRNHMQETGRKPATVNRHLISLKLYFEYLQDSERVTRNPAKPVKPVAQVKPTPRHLSDKDENKLLSVLEKYGDVRDRSLIIFMLNTGLRASEVCGLTWDAVTIRERSGWVDIRKGKGNKYRQVPLNATARAALTEWRESLKAEPLETGCVFTASGKPMPTRTLANIVKKWADLAQIQHLTPHVLRHRFAYRMADQTGLHVLADLMGHASIQTTTIYTRPTQEDLQKAVNKIDHQ